MTAIKKIYGTALKLFSRLCLPSDRSLYLSFFRVFLAFHILKKEFFLWPTLHILYNGSTFAVWSMKIWDIIDPKFITEYYLEWHIAYVLLASFMAFGIGKRATVFGVYVICYMLQLVEGYTLDGGDIFMRLLLLYMGFADSFEFLSLSKLRYKTATGVALNAILTNLAVASILLQLALIYCTSGLAKIGTPVWQNGTALYYALMNDRFCGTRWNVLLVQNAAVVTMMTYSVMLWEATFPFFAFFKKTRKWCLMLGCAFHAGIYIFMMINAFAILFPFVYGFFFTNDELRHFWEITKARLARIQKMFGGTRSDIPLPGERTNPNNSV